MKIKEEKLRELWSKEKTFTHNKEVSEPDEGDILYSPKGKFVRSKKRWIKKYWGICG